MVAITTSSLRANVYESIYDELTSASLLSGSVTVTAAFINEKEAFPQVVVNPANVNREGFSFDRSRSKQNIQVVVEIFTKKNKEIDQIADEIDTILRGLKMQSMQLIDWEEDRALSNDTNKNKIHLKTITITYLRG